MKVIGAGLPRTGTMSTHAALSRLGFRCYHMQDVPRERGHLRAWTALVQEREPMDWHWLFQNYEATVDAPACFYFEELIREFPNAEVLLTVRDADRWYVSVTALMDSVKPIRPLAHVIPRFRQFLKLVDGLTGKFVSTAVDRESSVAAFHRHNETVKRIVPTDRLLVFQVHEGWEPLCAFLGCEVPDTESPHLNERATAGRRVRDLFLSRPRRIALVTIAMAAVVALAWAALSLCCGDAAYPIGLYRPLQGGALCDGNCLITRNIPHLHEESSANGHQ